MKKNLMKKVFAVSLSIAMACSFVPASKPVTASAAAPYVSLRTTFKTLKVGGINTMTLKNNTIDWKITKVATSDRTVVMVYNRTESSFRMKGKSVGRATVKARLTTTARKTSNSKLVSCRVKVEEAATPVAPTSQTVATQAELDAALADKNLTSITISTTAAENFNIPAGTYDTVDLIVNAPNSDITNAGVFKSITVQAIKAQTWFENAVGNAMRFLTGGRLVVGANASLSSVTVAPTSTNAQLSIEANGEVKNIVISAKVKLDITGTSKAKISIVIEAAAKDTELTTAVPADVESKTDANVTFEKGAEGSTVKVTERGVTTNVKNNSEQAVPVTKADGNVLTANPNGGSVVANTPVNTTPVNPSTPGSSSDSTTTTSQAVAVDLSNKINITTASAITTNTSNSALVFTVDFSEALKDQAVSSVSGASIEYKLPSDTVWKTATADAVSETIERVIGTSYTYTVRYRIAIKDGSPSAELRKTVSVEF